MRKIKDLKGKLTLVAFLLVVIAVFYFFKIPCPIMHFLKIPCLGCGMTRAMLSLLSFDIVSAFSYHKMFWSLPILGLYLLFDGKLFKNKIINKTILILIGIGFLMNWLSHFIF